MILEAKTVSEYVLAILMKCLISFIRLTMLDSLQTSVTTHHISLFTNWKTKNMFYIRDQYFNIYSFADVKNSLRKKAMVKCQE